LIVNKTEEIFYMFNFSYKKLLKHNQ